MTTIYGQVKPVDYHSDAKQPAAPMQPEYRKALYWLIALAALIFLLVGSLCLHESVTQRTGGTEQLDQVTEGAPSHVEATIGEAIQALGVRR